MKSWNTSAQDPLVETIASLIGRGGRALDVGAGQGRDARYLASHGFEVVATEYDTEATAVLAEHCRDQPHITTITADILTYQPGQTFEAVVCDMVLHFMPHATAVQRAVANLQAWTKPGGYQAVMAYTSRNPAGKRPYLFAPGELAGYYQGWEILDYREEPTPWFQLPGETAPRRNEAVYLLARKH